MWSKVTKRKCHVCDQICAHVQCIVFEHMHVNKVLFPQVIDISYRVEVKGSLRQIHVSRNASVYMWLWMVQQAVEGLVHLESYHQSTELTWDKIMHKRRLWTSFYSLYFWTIILQIANEDGDVLFIQQVKVKAKICMALARN